MNDRDLRHLSERPIPWDELREHRVLGRVEAVLADPERRLPTARRPMRIGLALAAVVLAFVAVTATAWSMWPPSETSARAEVASWQMPPPSAAEPSLTLLDGSTALMHAGARVDLEAQSATEVRLVQSTGSVRYDVTPNPQRQFVVRAGGVQVRVLGTAFTVSLKSDEVTVQVHRGRVEVRRGDRRTELGLGETLQVERAPIEDELIIIDDEGPDPSAPPTAAREERRKPPVAASVLLARADQARVEGRLADAAGALSQLVRTHRRDTRAYSAWFQLGKVERARGRHAAAAAAFESCARHFAKGALSEDARAEAAASWLAAGKRGRAEAAAEAYLKRHRSGSHVARMERILDKIR